MLLVFCAQLVQNVQVVFSEINLFCECQNWSVNNLVCRKWRKLRKEHHNPTIAPNQNAKVDVTSDVSVLAQ